MIVDPSSSPCFVVVFVVVVVVVVILSAWSGS